jgi:hypothetical protein
MKQNTTITQNNFHSTLKSANNNNNNNKIKRRSIIYGKMIILSSALVKVQCLKRV